MCVCVCRYKLDEKGIYPTVRSGEANKSHNIVATASKSLVCATENDLFALCHLPPMEPHERGGFVRPQSRRELMLLAEEKAAAEAAAAGGGSSGGSSGGGSGGSGAKRPKGSGERDLGALYAEVEMDDLVDH